MRLLLDELTVDQSIEFQQNLNRFGIGVPEILEALSRISAGALIRVGS